MLDNEEQRKMYRDLWTLGDDATPPVPVLYGYGPWMPRGAAGLFFTNFKHEAQDRPRIWVRRAPVPADASEPDLDGATLPELITLAHERGHEMSWRNGTYAENSMAEEHRAWANAEEILRSMGFTEWDAFASAKEVSLAEHRRQGTPE